MSMTPKEIADRIIADGTENTSSGAWVVYFWDCYDEDEEDVRENADFIYYELLNSEQVAKVEIVDNEAFDITFYLGYCKNLEEEEKENNMELMCANGINMNEVLDRIYLGVQRTSNDEIAKKATEFEGIEQYLWVKIDDERSFKVPASLESEQLWEAAKRNTFAETNIRTTAEIMSEMMGFEVPEMEPRQYVLRNGNGFRGAAGVLDKNAIRVLGEKLGVEGFYMLPSSIHEVLLIPFCDYITKGELDEMVRAVNSAEVAYEDQLGDCAYELYI